MEYFKKLLSKTIDRINDKYFDYQFKKYFKPKHTKKKNCIYCNKDLSNEKPITYSYWVDTSGHVDYVCKECDRELGRLKEDWMKQNCEAFQYLPERPENEWGCGIARCFECPGHGCSEAKQKIEDEFKKTKRK